MAGEKLSGYHSQMQKWLDEMFLFFFSILAGVLLSKFKHIQSFGSHICPQPPGLELKGNVQ
jgi:hypothetical protein